MVEVGMVEVGMVEEGMVAVRMVEVGMMEVQMVEVGMVEMGVEATGTTKWDSNSKVHTRGTDVLWSNVKCRFVCTTAGSGEAALERAEERTREEGTAGSGGAALERAEERTREERTAGSGEAALERAEGNRERKPEEGTRNNVEEEVSMTEVASRESSMGPDDFPTPLASVHASPTRRPNPRSGREVLYPTASTSYPSLSSLEHLPPLLSYDEGDGIGRSPSLHGSGELLSEQEQVSSLFLHVITCINVLV